MARTIRSYVVDVWAKTGVLLGGVKTTSSAYFASRRDAEHWQEVTMQANREAGRDAQSSIFGSAHKPQISSSNPDGWREIEGGGESRPS